MKIRIKGDSIRLRLAQAEVDQIGANKMVSESTHFNNSTFTYSLKTHDSDAVVEATFDNNEICVSINKHVAQNWASTDQVGIQSNPSAALAVLIEKDFKCLTVREGEDESDLFKNPNTVC